MKANTSTHCGPIFVSDNTDKEAVNFAIQTMKTYATPHAIKWRMWLQSYWRKNYQIRTQGIWQLREEILLNSELQGVVDNLVTRTFTQRGCVVDRHKCCHGSRLMAVGARKRHSKCYERSKFKLNEKIDLSKSPKDTSGSLFWQSIYTKELFLHLRARKRDTNA